MPGPSPESVVWSPLLLVFASAALAQPVQMGDEPPVLDETIELGPEPTPPRCDPAAPVPGEVWEEAAPANPAAVDALTAYAFPPDLDWNAKGKPGIRTEGLVVVHRGRVVYERYREPWGPTNRHIGWSATKTVTGLLAGIARREGAIDPADSICAHLGGLPEASCGVTLDDLLNFGSNFRWMEDSSGHKFTANSTVAMLYGEGHQDMGRFVATTPLRGEAGGAYAYSTGDTTLLGRLLHDALLADHGRDWPYALLLDRIGAGAVVWERDATGAPLAGSHLWATPREFARIGLLLARGGCWAGDEVVPKEWIDEMSHPNDALRGPTYTRDSPFVAGKQLWLNQPLPEHGLDTRPFPQAPADLVMALGRNGQLVAAVPSLDLVVVRTAEQIDRSFSIDRLVAHAVALLGEGPVPTESQQADREQLGTPTPPPAEPYAHGFLRIGARFGAKEGCSCRFVAELPEEACEGWLQVAKGAPRMRVDAETQRSRASIFGLTRARAHYVNDREGCILDE